MDHNEIVNRYKNGETLMDLARVYKVRTTKIRYILTLNDVEIVNGGRWGADHQRWKGGRHVDRMGYVRITLPKDDPWRKYADENGICLEHRLVMAKHLNRPLQRSETVHHIDGDRSNNSIENLQLRSGPHGKGIILKCQNCGSHDIVPQEIPNG